ncbi:hypothetical protein RBB50_005329 [Rhinocladiella similis]
MAPGPRSPSILDHVNPKTPGPQGLRPLSRVTSAPEPRHPEAPFTTSTDRILLKRSSPMDRAYESPRVNTPWPSPTTSWSRRNSSPRGALGEPPDKKARLEYVPEREEEEAEPSRRTINYTSSPYIYPPDQLPPPPPPASSGTRSRSSFGSCGNCSDSESLLADLVTGFFDLQSQVCQVLNQAEQRTAGHQAKLELTKLGLKQSLAWVIAELRHTIRLVQDHASSRPGLPSLSDVVPPPLGHDIRRHSVHGQSSTAPTSIKDSRRIPLHLEPPRGDDYSRRPIDLADQMPRHFDQSLPSILQAEEPRRPQPHDQIVPPLTGQSPHPSSTSSLFTAQSPTQSQPSTRTLPSPPGGPYPRTASSGSAQYSPITSQSAHSSHLQDLQHQISTKTLALQTLQREHDQLLAAFSRSQIRCTALDKKAQVSDHEIITLTEDKIRLQQQVDVLEAQVHELTKARDEVTQQSTADGAQWRQIMAMSSQLQIKGAEDARRFKAERDAWDEERVALQTRIEELEAGKNRLPEKKVGSGSTTPVASDSILASDSVEMLRQEIVRLRRRCVDLELKLQELAGEAEQIDNAINAMESVRRSLSGKKRTSDET